MLGDTVNAAVRAEGLRAGCDDYLANLTPSARLLARLEALARRADRSRRGPVRVHDLNSIRLPYGVASGQVIDLQRREFLLLEHLLRHAAG
jgi:two-component system OmpR family response regulator